MDAKFEAHFSRLVQDRKPFERGGTAIVFGKARNARTVLENGASKVFLFLEESHGRLTSEAERSLGELVGSGKVTVLPGFRDVFGSNVVTESISAVVFSATPWEWCTEGRIRNILSFLAPVLLPTALVVRAGNGIRPDVIIDWRKEVDAGFAAQPSGLLHWLMWQIPALYRFSGDWHLSAGEPTLSDAFDRSLLPRAGRAYDLGCGIGKNSQLLCRAGLDVVGIDRADLAIRVASTHAEREGMKVRFVCGDVLDGSFYDKPASLVVDRGCFHCLLPAQRLRYLDRVWNALEPGGMLFLQVFAGEFQASINVSSFSEAELRRLFEPGFEFLEVRRAPYVGLPTGSYVAIMRKRVSPASPHWISEKESAEIGLGCSTLEEPGAELVRVIPPWLHPWLWMKLRWPAGTLWGRIAITAPSSVVLDALVEEASLRVWYHQDFRMSAGAGVFQVDGVPHAMRVHRVDDRTVEWRFEQPHGLRGSSVRIQVGDGSNGRSIVSVGHALNSVRSGRPFVKSPVLGWRHALERLKSHVTARVDA
ncbi:MAG TPA: class I SAM-dependent methyltransferase [Archangium sp.]|uniref:class I SAM-dependent methyltransferase n=1 Tax=Archangium sp. TaxID=1872627 RepID=UPI002E2EFFCE|nr:class I SAM-dependent methyltransferase [Archangium sp.]HEX5750555.1 class I SAM-dependent methyltransferase [Archangium sp.]